MITNDGTIIEDKITTRILVLVRVGTDEHDYRLMSHDRLTGRNIYWHFLNGVGGKAAHSPATPWNTNYELIKETTTPYYPDLDDNFWDARDGVIAKAAKLGIELDPIELARSGV